MPNQIPKNWQKVKLEKMISINPRQIGKDFKHKEIEYVDISSVGTGSLETTTIYPISDAPGRAKRLVVDGDTIISTVRPNRRSFYFFKNSKDNLVVSTGFAVLSPKPNITDSRFLYYLITRKSFTDYLASNVKGSAYPAITTDVIADAEVLVPQYLEQKRIASVLSAFDDKIELNNKIANNLRQMAQTIFKEWFVDFKFPGYKKLKFVDSELEKIPEGWEVKRIKDLVRINKGVSYSSKEISGENGIPMINLANFERGGGFNPLGIKYYSGEYKESNLVKPGDIVIAMTDLTSNREVIGHPARVSDYHNWEKIVISLDVCSLDTQEQYKEFFYYLMLRRSFSYYMASSAGGTNVAHLSKSVIEDFQFVLPEKEILEKFKKLIEPIFTQKSFVEMENEKLTKLRDLLLPKLMRGEIRV